MIACSAEGDINVVLNTPHGSGGQFSRSRTLIGLLQIERYSVHIEALQAYNGHQCRPVSLTTTSPSPPASSAYRLRKPMDHDRYDHGGKRDPRLDRRNTPRSCLAHDQN